MLLHSSDIASAVESTLAVEVAAKKGFSVIATANTRDKGVNEMSAALKRRFNIVVLPAPADLDSEIRSLRDQHRVIPRVLDLFLRRSCSPLYHLGGISVNSRCQMLGKPAFCGSRLPDQPG